jgi:hypothetical protein
MLFAVSDPQKTKNDKIIIFFTMLNLIFIISVKIKDLQAHKYAYLRFTMSNKLNN